MGFDVIEFKSGYGCKLVFFSCHETLNKGSKKSSLGLDHNLMKIFPLIRPELCLLVVLFSRLPTCIPNMLTCSNNSTAIYQKSWENSILQDGRFLIMNL